MISIWNYLDCFLYKGASTPAGRNLPAFTVCSQCCMTSNYLALVYIIRMVVIIYFQILRQIFNSELHICLPAWDGNNKSKGNQQKFLTLYWGGALCIFLGGGVPLGI